MGAIGVVLPVFFKNAVLIPKIHCTLIYLGEQDEVQINRTVLDSAVERLRSQVRPITIPVTGLAVYGHGKCTVMELESRTLKSYRDFLESELRRDGIVSASQYAYRPHVTIAKHDPATEPQVPWPKFEVPPFVWVDRPVVWWNT